MGWTSDFNEKSPNKSSLRASVQRLILGRAFMLSSPVLIPPMCQICGRGPSRTETLQFLKCSSERIVFFVLLPIQIISLGVARPFSARIWLKRTRKSVGRHRDLPGLVQPSLLDFHSQSNPEHHSLHLLVVLQMFLKQHWIEVGATLCLYRYWKKCSQGILSSYGPLHKSRR